ncbi:ATP-binding protein [Phyllobacterium sp. 628]|uniref:AAA family ATPase n=1 Tax=Phyllobacterium sp. 628 TaxID=2718938 RepID=UPI001662313B|nr:AAA family ATPase [Phyllobacterium sp. 628]QND52566.1 ATP-binding protein [Phyllobacterium sp. 628]
MLIIMSGLPGTGKSTIARELARRLNGMFLRADTIAQALISAEILKDDDNPAAYIVGYALAEENLRAGATVIADYVNGMELTRQAWRDVAARANVPFHAIEVICSDEVEHRRRVETRVSDIAGLELPTWKQVVDRTFEKWGAGTTTVDTSITSLADAISGLLLQLGKGRDDH